MILKIVFRNNKEEKDTILETSSFQSVDSARACPRRPVVYSEYMLTLPTVSKEVRTIRPEEEEYLSSDWLQLRLASSYPLEMDSADPIPTPSFPNERPNDLKY